jgi:hypothetical protein
LISEVVVNLKTRGEAHRYARWILSFFFGRGSPAVKINGPKLFFFFGALSV